MRTRTKILGAIFATAVVVTAWSIGASQAAADDARLTVAPAVLRTSDAGNSGATVQHVRWGPYGYGYRGYYRPYRPYYYGGGGYYAPYYGGYYAPPVYSYGYSYPAYGYGYGYPAYGYGYGYGYPAYGGIGIRTGRVGIGIW